MLQFILQTPNFAVRLRYLYTILNYTFYMYSKFVAVYL